MDRVDRKMMTAIATAVAGSVAGSVVGVVVERIGNALIWLALLVVVGATAGYVILTARHHQPGPPPAPTEPSGRMLRLRGLVVAVAVGLLAGLATGYPVFRFLREDPSIVIAYPAKDVICADNTPPGACQFEVSGTVRDLGQPKELEVHILVYPVNPPGAGWYPQGASATPSGTGAWTQSPVYVGTTDTPARTGDQVRVRAIASRHGEAKYKGVRLRDLPAGTVLPKVEDIDGVLAFSDEINLKVNYLSTSGPVAITPTPSPSSAAIHEVVITEPSSHVVTCQNPPNEGSCLFIINFTGGYPGSCLGSSTQVVPYVFVRPTQGTIWFLQGGHREFHQISHGCGGGYWSAEARLGADASPARDGDKLGIIVVVSVVHADQTSEAQYQGRPLSSFTPATAFDNLTDITGTFAVSEELTLVVKR